MIASIHGKPNDPSFRKIFGDLIDGGDPDEIYPSNRSMRQSLLVNGTSKKAWNDFSSILMLFVLNVERSVTSANT